MPQNDLNDVYVSGTVKQFRYADDKLKLLVTVNETASKGGKSRVYDVPVLLLGTMAAFVHAKLQKAQTEPGDSALQVAVNGYLSETFTPKKDNPAEKDSHVVVLATDVLYLGQGLLMQMTRVAYSGEVSYHMTKSAANGKPKQWMIVRSLRNFGSSSAKIGVPVTLYAANDDLDRPLSRGSRLGVTGRLDSYYDNATNFLKLGVLALNSMVANDDKITAEVDQYTRQNFVGGATAFDDGALPPPQDGDDAYPF